MNATAAGGRRTDTEVCRGRYLREGWSFKEGRRGHESLQQRGRRDGEVVNKKTHTVLEVLHALLMHTSI